MSPPAPLVPAALPAGRSGSPRSADMAGGASGAVRWTTPNMLTVARVVAAPCLALSFVVFERPAADWVAFVLFVAASLTDYVDGWIARSWDEASELGKMLDPIADKAMIVIALAVLTGLIGFNFWFIVPMAVILLREVLVSGLREYLGDVKLPVTDLAKWKTTSQMFAIGCLLLLPPDLHIVTAILGFTLLWIAALLTAISGWDYFRKGLAVIREREGS